MKLISTCAVQITFALVICVMAHRCVAQDSPIDPVDRLTVEKIEEFGQKTAESPNLDEETQKKIAESLQRAGQAVKQANQLDQQARSFRSATETATKRANDRKEQINQLRNLPPASMDDSLTLAELEQQLNQQETEVAALKQQTSETDRKIADRTARRKAIRSRLTAIEHELEQLQTRLDQPPPSGELAAVTEARRIEIQASLQRLRAESPALEMKLASYDAEDAVDWLQLSRDEASIRLANGEQTRIALQELVQSRRTIEANKQVTSAAEEAESEIDPQLKALAQRNVELARQFKELTEKIRQTEEQLTRAIAIRDRWDRTAQSAVEKVKAVGLTDAIGAMLRQQKSSLPNPRRHQADIDRLRLTIDDAQLVLLDLEDERSRKREPAVSTDTDRIIEQKSVELISTQSEYLSRLVRTQRNYFDKLIELSTIEEQIIDETTDYRNFIDERILWIRSGPPLYWATSLDHENLWLFDRGQWDGDAVRAIRSDLRSDAHWYIVAAVVFLLLLIYGKRIRSEIRSLGATAESYSCVSMLPTIRATSYTILAALPWPLLFAFLAWRLSQLPTDNPIALSLAQGLSSVAGAFLPLEFFRQVCQPKGLGESHFSWPNQSVALVRRSLRSLMVVGLPLVLLIAVLHADGMRLGRDTLQRLMFIAAMAALSVFASRVLNPKRGIFSAHLLQRPDSWASRLQGIWYWSMVLAPALLAAIAFFGYAYTAHQLVWRLHATIVLVTLLSIATAFLTRALLLQRRRINIDTAQSRRMSLEKSSELTTEAADIPTAEELRSQIAQSRSLLRTVMVGLALIGIWMAWVDVLPALGFLEQRPLWRSIETVAEMKTDEMGNVNYVTRDVVDNVTIVDVAFALLIAIGTAIAAKNIPGLLEIAILRRLPIDASVRYAIETVVSYIIILVGLIIACAAIGIHWKQVQWMAAALTFGLAFGLQEMFANFIAGIIILVERPVRVGDIVTVDDVTGTVTRVRIRATTITNWDRKDYLVPNKDFITGRVLNWTLSSRYNRVVIPVGVAYGSDKDETVRQLLRVAIEHPRVVSEPAPSVTFEEFANSSLNYVLRCYISMDDMSSRLKIVHELHTGIDDAFRKAGIEIPFPQQDIHLRSVDPDVRLS